MKTFKFFGKLIIAFLFLLFITGCSGGDSESDTSAADSVTYNGVVDGADTAITIAHRDDTLENLEIVASFNLTDLGLDEDTSIDDTQKEAIETALASTFEQYSDNQGVTLENEFADNTFIVTIRLNAAEVDAETFASLTGTSADSSAETGSDISYQDFIDSLQEAGFEETTEDN